MSSFACFYQVFTSDLTIPISITKSAENYNVGGHVGGEQRTVLVRINGGLFEIPIRKFSHLLDSGRRVAEGQQSALISPGLRPASDLRGMVSRTN